MDNRILIFAVFLIIAYMLFNKRESLAVGGYLWNPALSRELLYDENRLYHHRHHHRHHHRPHFWRNYHHYHHHYPHLYNFYY